jgi:hypothetical protein
MTFGWNPSTFGWNPLPTPGPYSRKASQTGHDALLKLTRARAGHRETPPERNVLREQDVPEPLNGLAIEGSTAAQHIQALAATSIDHTHEAMRVVLHAGDQIDGMPSTLELGHDRGDRGRIGCGTADDDWAGAPGARRLLTQLGGHDCKNTIFRCSSPVG